MVFLYVITAQSRQLKLKLVCLSAMIKELFQTTQSCLTQLTIRHKQERVGLSQSQSNAGKPSVSQSQMYSQHTQSTTMSCENTAGNNTKEAHDFVQRQRKVIELFKRQKQLLEMIKNAKVWVLVPHFITFRFIK